MIHLKKSKRIRTRLVSRLSQMIRRPKTLLRCPLKKRDLLRAPSKNETTNPFGVAPLVDEENEAKKENEATNPFGATPLVEENQAKNENETTNPFGATPLVEENQAAIEQENQSESPFGIKPLVEETETKTVDTVRKGPSPVENSATTQEMENPFGERTVNKPIEVEMVEVPRNEVPEETFEEKFWTYLKSNAYENWAPVPNSKGDFYVGSSPHGAFLKMYLNRIAVGNPVDLPAGSIIVKENYNVDRSTLKAITVMYRSKAYNPDAGDWYWVKFNPDGTVDSSSVESGSKPIAGKVTSCIECHSDAGGDDFIFFNDK